MQLKGEAEAVPWDVPDPQGLCRRAAGPDDPVWDVPRPERGRHGASRLSDLQTNSWDWNHSRSLLRISGWNRELSLGNSQWILPFPLQPKGPIQYGIRSLI